MEDKLKDIYNENIQWLNFAELKNGALLTLAVAIFAAVISWEDNLSCWGIFFAIYSLVIIFVCSLSFIPFLNRVNIIKNAIKKSYKKNNKDSIHSNNIIFYVCIFLSEKEIYKKALKKVFDLKGNYCFSKIEENYIEQILQISTIASIKYYIFKKSMGLFCGMLLLLIVVLIAA